ncbi:BMP family ABC transporter substrate-binding protein [Desulfovibrio oxyclinae]|jgi:basic membrane protein A|uniref:BMP family ABC transporter substrate-binding protein n=1 Tax=Desulfovibrio oxyclinae TaxID=63560 RepID=UPI000370C5C2|nr:BMP family ABC transporter substrate-binding protein [Desulfovibrio oxyclinae]
MKRFARFFAVAACAVMLLALAACGGGEQKAEEKPAEKAEKAASAEKEDQLKVGFVYVSPVGDAGYSYSHDLGRKAVAEMPGVKTSFVESVMEGADSERVIRNMANNGFDLVFTTSFGYMDPTKRVAKEFPDVAFMHCSGFKKAENMSNYFGRMYQARYLTGLVAGSMTEGNKIGYVAAFPIPEVIRGINAFTLGVREANPEAQVRVVWTKTWYDPALEKDAAISLLDVGCDVIAQHQDSPGPQEAAQERGKYSVGYNSDMSAFAPKAHLTAAIWNWAPVYKETVKKVQEGTWEGNQSLWWGMETGVVDVAPMGDMVPAEVKKLVEEKKAELEGGKDIVFTGPIKNQKGEVVIPEGEKADDGQLLGMNYFVEGVIGNTE